MFWQFFNKVHAVGDKVRKKSGNIRPKRGKFRAGYTPRKAQPRIRPARMRGYLACSSVNKFVRLSPWEPPKPWSYISFAAGAHAGSRRMPADIIPPFCAFGHCVPSAVNICRAQKLTGKFHPKGLALLGRLRRTLESPFLSIIYYTHSCLSISFIYISQTCSTCPTAVLVRERK